MGSAGARPMQGGPRPSRFSRETSWLPQRLFELGARRKGPSPIVAGCEELTGFLNQALDVIDFYRATLDEE